MNEDRIQPASKDKPKAGILREDEGKRTPPAHTGYVTGGDNPANRPEQGPDVPPHERTEGIP
ncbi:hypothetical protein K3G39_17240 [Pontibacter sp. HSC-14F20]|uniref:hypothetical protein n=1 Tax=Pontibacter sp. HSC-14F20 TaxID=2864136 RepID=UPI001C73DAB6|nr:hypothetical protein [Pontibacter sp. HSC-14F20]MBX0334985.1 hypothetical protein [Pontibacter sp. HSC-14F20]